MHSNPIRWDYVETYLKIDVTLSYKELRYDGHMSLKSRRVEGVAGFSEPVSFKFQHSAIVVLVAYV
jgi:hypothetical protein